MGLFDSILGAASKGDTPDQANPLIGIIGGLLAQGGGLQGLANKFSQSGQGNAFQSWVGMGENKPVSSNQIQNVLGPEQVNAIATKLGVDPAIVSTFLAEYLPKIVDKLTPAGKIDPAADHQQGWRLCCHRVCKAFLANPRLTAQRAHNIRRAVALAPTAAPLQLAGTEFTPTGLADGDLFGLNKRGNLILNLRGVGDTTGVRLGLAGALVIVFLRISLGVGEAAGDSAVERDSALSTGEVASVRFCVRFFGSEGDSVGVPVSSCD